MFVYYFTFHFFDLQIEIFVEVCFSVQDAKSGLGSSAVFFARNRFAVLDKLYNQIQIRNMQNEITKKVPSPCPVTLNIFYAGTGKLLCQSEDKVGLSRKHHCSLLGVFAFLWDL